MTGLVGRRYFDERVGLVAATIAALYPGFWVLDGNLLSEPLAVLVLGLLTLAVAEVRDHPRIGWSILAGALCGLLALVRSEALTLVVIIVAPVILLTRTVSFRQRLRLLVGAVLACLVVVAPWAAFLSIYYERPVLLSTNAGYLFLSTNCPPSTYEGRLIGYYDPRCPLVFGVQNSTKNTAEIDALAVRQATENVRENLDRLPSVAAARLGRLLGVFRPAQTVQPRRRLDDDARMADVGMGRVVLGDLAARLRRVRARPASPRAGPAARDARGTLRRARARVVR